MKKLFFVVAIVTVVSMATHAQDDTDRESLYILFSANSASLTAVGTEQAIVNQLILIQVVELLQDNPEYRLLIDGHANSVLGTAREERDALLPLSRQRAEAVANFLVEYYGISRNRLIIAGAGGGFPIDDNDGTQNRRVSFLLIPPR